MTLALSAKAFSVSAPSIWILYVTVDLGTFMCTLILNCLTLLVVNMKTLPSHCHYVPLIHLRHMALYKCVFDLIWAYCGTCSNSTAKSAVQINVAFLNGPLYQAAYVQCTCMRIILPGTQVKVKYSLYCHRCQSHWCDKHENHEHERYKTLLPRRRYHRLYASKYCVLATFECTFKTHCIRAICDLRISQHTKGCNGLILRDVRQRYTIFIRVINEDIWHSYLVLEWSIRRGYPAAILVPRRVTISSLPDLGFTLHSTHSHSVPLHIQSAPASVTDIWI